MTYADVVGQMQQIQVRLAQLAPTAPTTAKGATAFASALTEAAAAGPATSASATAATLTGSGPAGVTGDDVVQAALQYKGVPYVLGGESKSGIDCSGLVQAAFKDLGVDVPRLVHQQQTIGQEVGSLKDAKPGDLVVLAGGDHIAIWMGNGTAVHAPYAGRTVSVQKAWFTDADVTTIRRVVPSADDAARTAAVSAASAQGAGVLGSWLPGTSSTGALGSAGTSQQLLAARAALLGTAG